MLFLGSVSVPMCHHFFEVLPNKDGSQPAIWTLKNGCLFLDGKTSILKKGGCFKHTSKHVEWNSQGIWCLSFTPPKIKIIFKTQRCVCFVPFQFPLTNLFSPFPHLKNATNAAAFRPWEAESPWVCGGWSEYRWFGNSVYRTMPSLKRTVCT